ncbi:YhgE/Pip domain-containing protein [Microbacterium flavum]|uniref:YhgE/Pip domain-containing protein n=2 Tax=Microbacterium flavum TaxID=415216 RepID=A0ABS5XPT7_9MICO|nr:YhgE/Pip domain-containing protein [Microbacterium flavum]MBT8796549.1 YhgE/Pip domain-containing protein [Microbacterium flavum]
MTLPLERARSRRPVTWLTLIGVLLLPVVIGGILVAALYNPVERLDGMRAAIVNEDEPVTINGQYVPLGRQLTAGLVKGSDALPSNLDWTISNTDDAATGLADGTYDAVITIPANFSAAATSTAPGSTPERATITAQTAPDSRIVDEAITSQVASAAASVLGQQLSTVYLENVFLGFTTLGDQLGTAADGAHQLADGATKTQSGAVSLADGVRQLATGAGALSGGLDQLSSGAGQLASGVTSYAAGAHRSADGLGQLSNGLNQLVQPSAALAAGMQQFADQAQGISVPQRVIDAAQNVADNSATVQQNAEATVAQLQQLAAECATSGSPAEFCAALTRAADEAEAALPTVTDLIGNSQQIADGLGQINQLPAATAQLAAGSAGISQGIAGLAGGLSQAAAGANELATGADGLAAGAQGIADGAAQSATGAGQLASGATTAADGADQLADGIGQVATGTGSLADGLDTAASALPSYTNQQATDLASVVSDPVTASGTSSTLFGASAIPLLAMLALWFGGLASFIALQAVPRYALSSRRPSALLALRSLAPAAAIGAGQGILVAAVVQLAARYDAHTWWGFAILAVLAGVAFAAVNQALVAVFGGAGRWISALVGVMAVATGIVSTVPGILTQIAALLPTTPAYDAFLAALTSAGGLRAGAVGMVVWAVLAFIATVIAVTRRRTAGARALLQPAPALA